jgi:hypothetical protein
MEDDLEALMWATLERCGRTSDGYRLDARHPLIALLITESLLRRRRGGFLVLTDKGRAILKLRPKAKAKRSARSLRQPGGTSAQVQASG